MPKEITKLVGVILSIVLLLCVSKYWPRQQTNTEQEVNKSYGTVENESVDFDSLNQIAKDMKFKIGTNDDKDNALAYANNTDGNSLIPEGRSAKLLYFDLISPVRGNFTEDAAQYAVENCNVGFANNALFWVNMYTAAGYSDDLIKEAMSSLQLNGGGFTNSEIDKAFENRTTADKQKEEMNSDGDTVNQYAASLNELTNGIWQADMANAATDLDKEKCKEMLDAVIKEGGNISLEEAKYILRIQGGFSSDIVDSVVLDDNSLDFGNYARELAKQYKKDKLSRDDAYTILRYMREFSVGETKWALNQVYGKENSK